MKDSEKKELRGIVHFENQAMTAMSANLIRRGLDQFSYGVPRILTFPPNKSLGTVFVVPTYEADYWWRVIINCPLGPSVQVEAPAYDIKEPWEGVFDDFPAGKIIDARNSIKIPADKQAILCMNGFSLEDLHPLPQLKPHDLAGLDLSDLFWRATQNFPGHCIQGLTGLSWLRMPRCKIFDWEFIGYLTDLTWLDMSFSCYEVEAPIYKLRQLRSLNLSHAKVLDLTLLCTLSKLERLDLSCADFSHFDALSHLSNLQYIDLRGATLTNTDRSVCDDAVRRLQEQLPDCVIWY